MVRLVFLVCRERSIHRRVLFSKNKETASIHRLRRYPALYYKPSFSYRINYIPSTLKMSAGECQTKNMGDYDDVS